MTLAWTTAELFSFAGLAIAGTISWRMIRRGQSANLPVLTAWTLYWVADEVSAQLVLFIRGGSGIGPYYYYYYGSGLAQHVVSILVLAELFSKVGRITAARLAGATAIVLAGTAPLLPDLQQAAGLHRPAHLLLFGSVSQVILIMLIITYLIRRPEVHPGRTALGICGGMFLIAGAGALGYAHLLVDKLGPEMFKPFVPFVETSGITLILASIWNPQRVETQSPPGRPIDPKLQHALRTILRGTPDA